MAGDASAAGGSIVGMLAPMIWRKFLTATVIGRLQCFRHRGVERVRVVEAIGFVAAGGGVGGMGAYLSSAGLRRRVSLPEGPSETSIIVAALIGAIAAAGNWVMQSGNSSLDVLGSLSGTTGLRLQDLGSAFGVGLVGSKWLTNHNKAEMLRHSAARVALRPTDPEASIAMASGDPRRIKSALAQSAPGLDPAIDSTDPVDGS